MKAAIPLRRCQRSRWLGSQIYFVMNCYIVKRLICNANSLHLLTPQRQPQSGTGHIPCLANHCLAWCACRPWPQLAQNVTNLLSAMSVSFAFCAAAASFDCSPSPPTLLPLRGATMSNSGVPSHCRHTAHRGKCLPQRGHIVPLASARRAAICDPCPFAADSKPMTAFCPCSSAGRARLALQCRQRSPICRAAGAIVLVPSRRTERLACSTLNRARSTKHRHACSISRYISLHMANRESVMYRGDVNDVASTAVCRSPVRAR